MTKFRSFSYREIVKIIKKLGFEFKRNPGGSHEIWWNEDTKKTCVIPHHREIKAGTVKSIFKQAGLREDHSL